MNTLVFHPINTEAKSEEEIRKLILTESNFETKLKLYQNHFSLMKSKQRLRIGKEIIFCTCAEHQKTIPNFNEKLKIYSKYLKIEVEALKQRLDVLSYQDRLIEWYAYYDDRMNVDDYIFDSDNSLALKLTSEEYDDILRNESKLGCHYIKLSIEPKNSEEIEIYNQFYYEKQVDRYFKTDYFQAKEGRPKPFDKLGPGFPNTLDFETLKEDFEEEISQALYPDKLIKKKIKEVKKKFKSIENKSSDYILSVDIFQQLVDGNFKNINFQKKIWNIEELWPRIAANEAYKYLVFLETYNQSDTVANRNEISTSQLTKQVDTATYQTLTTHVPPNRSIIFNNAETIVKLFNNLKIYFPQRDDDLKAALQGINLETPLLFPHNQNKLVELFRRLKYNGKIINTPTEINTWLCFNFRRLDKKGESIKLNNSTVWDTLTKGKGIPPNKGRLCLEDWVFKSHLQLQEETRKEQI